MGLPDWLLPGENPGGLAIGAAALALAYKLWRLVKSDRREDRADDMAERIRTALLAETKELRERADRFASERNTAREAAATAAAENRALVERQKELTAEITRLRELVGPHGHDD